MATLVLQVVEYWETVAWDAAAAAVAAAAAALAVFVVFVFNACKMFTLSWLTIKS